MAAEGQAGIRLEDEIALKVAGKRREDCLLAVHQSGAGILLRGPRRLKVDAVQGKSRFQFRDLRGHRRWSWRRRRRRRFHGHRGHRRSHERRIPVIAYGAGDGDGTGSRLGQFSVAVASVPETLPALAL